MNTASPMMASRDFLITSASLQPSASHSFNLFWRTLALRAEKGVPGYGIDPVKRLIRRLPHVIQLA
jgi:hypothetical protein